MAVVNSRAVVTPRAIPDAHRLADTGFRRLVRTPSPPTLGDELNEAMRLRVHTTGAAAEAMGVTSDEVLAWSADVELPDRRHEPALADYLQVDERRLRALLLRSQMRWTQRRIRT